MDEENKINEQVEEPVAPTEPVVEPPKPEEPVTPTEPVVEPPKTEVPPTNGIPNNDNPNPPKKGHAGAIIAGIVIVALIAAIVALSVVLLNKDDEDSDKKSSKKNTTNSSVTNDVEDEDDDKNTTNKTKAKDEDEDEDDDEDEDVVEAGGIEYLADYSAFNMDVEDIKELIEPNMVDPDQKLKKVGNEYEIDCKNDITCVVAVDKKGYVTSVDFVGTFTQSNYETAAFQWGYQYGYLVGVLGYDDLSEIQTKIQDLASEESNMKQPSSYPATVLENSFTESHSKFEMKMIANSENEIEGHFLLTPSKK